ncbi:ABC transporter substrate-binding protein [Streptomyces malaysiensis]|uniref:ABC transporter substrate-binding protein n=1 Tax=Streptomyces malaysiensis TaxID=92644 RepID=UPI0008536855|nr:PhnD/SsuA/transferrin family substrate-binding protein [Streptomyces sp. SPMA113]
MTARQVHGSGAITGRAVPTRRTLLRSGGAALAATGFGPLLAACGESQGGGSGAAARVEDTQAGTAGAVIRPISERRHLLGDLRLSYIAGTGPGDVQNKLLSGALDVASMGPIGAAVSLAAGADVLIFSTSLANHVRWLVPENSPYRRIEDLRGKQIATPPKNSDAYRSTQLACAVGGIDFEREYHAHPGAVLAGLSLFERGDVDAIVTIEPNATRLVAKGARQLTTVTDLWRHGSGSDADLLLNGQGAKRGWVERNERTAAALAELRLRAHQYIHDRPGILAELHQYYGIPAAEKKAIALLPERLVGIYPTEWAGASFTSMRDQLRVAAKVGLIKAVPDKTVYRDLG